jgi:hypothetical protein
MYALKSYRYGSHRKQLRNFKQLLHFTLSFVSATLSQTSMINADARSPGLLNIFA